MADIAPLHIFLAQSLRDAESRGHSNGVQEDVGILPDLAAIRSAGRKNNDFDIHFADKGKLSVVGTAK
nr:hypothetical protein [Hafnia alvei]